MCFWIGIIGFLCEYDIQFPDSLSLGVRLLVAELSYIKIEVPYSSKKRQKKRTLESFKFAWLNGNVSDSHKEVPGSIPGSALIFLLKNCPTVFILYGLVYVL